MARVAWRGVVVDDRTASMLDEVARLTPPDLYVSPSQGSWSGSVAASAGTHAGCGAVDLRAANLTPGQRATLVRELRRVGFAAWLRTPAQSDWPWHVHAVAIQRGGRSHRGCLSASAHRQVDAYYSGRNGLASNGPDDGPRDYVGTTWESYREDDTMPLSDEDLDKIARRVWSFEVDDRPARWWLRSTGRIVRRWLGPGGDPPPRTRQGVILDTVRGIDEKVDEFGADDPDPDG